MTDVIAIAVPTPAPIAVVVLMPKSADGGGGLVPIAGHSVLANSSANPAIPAGVAIDAFKELLDLQEDDIPGLADNFGSIAIALGGKASSSDLATVATVLTAKANSADLAAVAKSGRYIDLSGLPAIAPPTVEYVSGHGYGPLVQTSASSAINTFNEMEFMPLPIGAAQLTIKSLMLRLQSGVAGATVQLALYGDQNGAPFNLLGNTTDLPATTGPTTIIGDLLVPAILTGQSTVWLAANFATVGTKPQIVGMSTAANMLATVGFSTPSDAVSSTQFGWRQAQAYGIWPVQISGSLTKMGTNTPLLGFVVA